MAVNLRATATLNTKPYIAGIRSIKAATESLNKSATNGSTAVTSNVLAEKAAREATSKAVHKNQQAVSKYQQAVTSATAANQDYLKTQAESVRIADKITNAYRTMSVAEARHTESKLRTAEARLARMRAVADGIEGTAMSPYIDRVNASEIRQAKTRENLRRVTANSAVAEANLASKLRETNLAQIAGANSARTFTSSLSGLTNEKLKLQAASERLGAAEARLASAMAKSNGVITPAVSQARAGVISATAAYNALAEAQANVGKTGVQAASGLAAQRYMYHDVSRQLAGLGIGLAAIPVAAVAVGAVWENQFANVIRTSDPDLMHSEQRINALRTSLVNMAKTMPTSFGNLTEIATLGNQMGVSATELEGFTRAVAMFSATSGIAVDTAATAFGRLRTVAADANFSYMDVADSILKVGVNSVATEEEIINVTTQISSVAAAAGFSTKEMIGLSGAMASVRIPPELSRSIITRTFGQIDNAVQKNGTELQTIARLSGRTVDEIRKQWGGEQSATIFTDFLTGLHTAGSQARGELEAIGITSVRDTPSLMRLANAKDSEGVSGGLLKQTINDANNAAGTVQEQYSIMAETVVGRLKILGNTILSFFNTLGSQTSGFVKNTIDGLTNLFKFLDRIADDPFANWALGAMAAVGGIALATSALAKLTANVKLFQHVASVTGSTGFFAAIGKSGKAGATGELAAMSPLLLGAASAANSFVAGGKAAGSAWANAGRSIKTTALSAFSSFANHIGYAEAGNRAMNSALATTAATTPKVTGALANLVKFGLGPVGLGITTIATVGYLLFENWAKDFYNATTSAEDLAKSLSSIDMTKPYELDRALKSINISGRDLFRFGTQGVNPFGGGLDKMVSDAAIFSDYLKELRSYQTASGFEVYAAEYAPTIANNNAARRGLDVDAYRAGLRTLDDTFKEMREAGNDSRVLAIWQKIGEGADNSSDKVKLYNTLLEDMDDEKEALQNLFDLQGIENFDVGLAKLNQLGSEARDIAAEFEGTSIIADVLGIDDEAAASFGKIMNDATAAFIDFSAALEAGTKVDDEGVFTGFSMEDFTTSLEDNIAVQEAWMNNMRTLVTKTAPDVIEAMGELGPEGRYLAQSLVDGLASADPAVKAQAEKTLATFEAAVYSSKIDFGPHLAEYKNVLEKAGAMLDTDPSVALNAQLAASFKPDQWTALSSGINAVVDKHGIEAGGRLGKRLFEGLNAGTISVDDFSVLSNAFSSIGYNASKSLMDALEGGLDMETINKRIERIQMPKLDASQFTIDESEKTQITQQFKNMFGARGVDIPANFSLDMSMGELRTALKQPGLLPDIEAGLKLNDVIAQGQLNGFRSWALANGIDVEMTANPTLAYVDVQNFLDHADSQNAWVMLNALKEPAEGTLWEFTTLANGTEAVVNVDADTGAVTGKIYELVTNARGETVWKEVDANTEVAKAKIAEINALAEADTSSDHHITDNAADVRTRILANDGLNTSSTHTITEVTESGSAYGNVFEPFARGGVREDHRPQIAPAGAMRLWAEPETGGEAYIPFAQDRRKRAVGILDTVADRFGYSLVRGNNVARFADGGQYMAQSMSRSQRSIAPRSSASSRGVSIGEVTFTDSTQKDQFREFTRTLNRFARGNR